MNKIEYTPDGKPTIVPPGSPAGDGAGGNDFLREILPIVFHKMKNKLTPVLGYAQILQTRTNDDFFKDRLGRIERNTAELSESLNTLKDYFKPAPVKKKPADINLILKRLAACWQEIARSEKVKIVLELGARLPKPALNAVQMRVLLLNMVDNAVQALKNKEVPGKEIRLTTVAENASLKLVIRDNGRGMSADELASIWAPFYSTFPDHAGLGLVLCEKIIANHDAVCSVSSVPGEFSQFVIVFPGTDDKSQKQKKSAEANSRSQS
jgi:signal transduction histidine kinase